jgi:hypothetical protein
MRKQKGRTTFSCDRTVHEEAIKHVPRDTERQIKRKERKQ